MGHILRAPLIPILFIAAFLRLHLLDEVPGGTHVDESINILDARDIARDGGFRIWNDHIGGRPTLHLQICGGIFRLVGPSVESARMVSTAFGLTAIALLYLVAEKLFGFRVACISAALLAVNHSHIHFSRLIFEAALAPAFLLLSLYLLLKSRGSVAAAVSGAICGAGLYTYAAFRIASLIPLSCCLMDRRAGRRALTRSGSFVAAMTLVAAPLLHFAIKNPGKVAARYDDVNVFARDSWEGLIFNLFNYPRMFFDIGDLSSMQNLPGEPAFLLPVSLFFAVGCLICFIRPRDWRRWFLLSWLFLGLLPAMLTQTVETPHTTRSLLAFPAACIVAALGISGAASFITPKRARTAWELLVLLLALAINYTSYFELRYRDPAIYDRFTASESRIGRAARGMMEEGIDVFVDSGFSTWEGTRTAIVANALPSEPSFVDAYTPLPRIAKRTVFLVTVGFPREKVRAANPVSAEREIRDRFGRLHGHVIEAGRDDKRAEEISAPDSVVHDLMSRRENRRRGRVVGLVNDNPDSEAGLNGPRIVVSLFGEGT